MARNMKRGRAAREERRVSAEVRAEERAARSPQEQIDTLDAKGVRAADERERLLARIIREDERVLKRLA